ncbi:MAG: response regulator transcription factor [Acidobacteriota bacterium]
MRVLIADDDPVTRSLLESHLTEWGYDVTGCADAAEAWRILQENDGPRLVLLDWTMPMMDGLAVCREVRDLAKDDYLYVILLTARGEREDIVEGLEAGADDYIIKPFDRHELRARVGIGRRILELQSRLVASNNEPKQVDADLTDALATEKKLSGFLPICATCKKIRDDNGRWQQVEIYVRDHSEAQFSHSMCPDCAGKIYAEFYRRAQVLGDPTGVDTRA